MALFLALLYVGFVSVFAKTKCYGSGAWGDLTIIWKHGRENSVLIPDTSGVELTPTQTHVL